MMLEMYTDHLAMAEAGKGHGGHHVVALKSKYFVMTTAALAFVVMNWVVNSVTFSRIRKLNSEINQVSSKYNYNLLLTLEDIQT